MAAILSVLLFFTASSAFSKNESLNLEGYIGLYELIDKKCEVVNDAFNPCGSTLFFEIVKGKFFGIKDSELAYVFWSGDPETDPELQYTAHLIQHHKTLDLSNNRLWLNKDNSSQEYLSFSDGKLNQYIAVYADDDRKATRSVQYSLRLTKRANHPQYRLPYPDTR